jgi:hypothetical protein
MKKNLIPIVFFVAMILVFAGTVSASNNSNGVVIQKTEQKNVLDSGASKFYWGERGGIFSYTWTAFKTSNGVLVKIHYKTINNSWNSAYYITKASKNTVKIVETSPEVKLYSGHSSVTSYAKSSLTPVQFYNKLKTQIKRDGYFSV